MVVIGADVNIALVEFGDLIFSIRETAGTESHKAIIPCDKEYRLTKEKHFHKLDCRANL
jgi:hypothetical protein